ncbi:uncharacterized protein [Rutidosis leptorrhynchoides]|uniref:uncharacterized protein n=1 Tax=Rutidosis leptorrhynchoides TaxID=125765 RepID=UPI003A995C25
MSAHFLATSETSSLSKLAQLYMNEIVARHRIPFSIVSDRDSRFVLNFWQSLQPNLGTRVNLSTSYHPQTDVQSERTFQTLEDMLRACVLEYGGSWDTYLPLVEFAYNNSYHSSIDMPPYEMLYDRQCRTPSCWLEAGEKQCACPEIVQQTAEKVAIAREKLKAVRDRQKMYADPPRWPVTFVVVVLDLPTELAGIHNTFNVCYLRNCKVDDESQILPLQDLKVDSSKILVEEPIKILDKKVTKLRKKWIPMVLVEWKHSLGANLTWEAEELMKARYPQLFDLDQIPRTESS